MAGDRVDGPFVVVGVGAAFCGGSHMVYFVGSGLAADVADAPVASDDPGGGPLLFPS